MYFAVKVERMNGCLTNRLLLCLPDLEAQEGEGARHRHPSLITTMKTPKASSPTSSWCVYCLLSADFGKTYVGVTSDVHRRCHMSDKLRR
eukprot:c20855_g1_i1 orf=394-663(-)